MHGNNIGNLTPEDLELLEECFMHDTVIGDLKSRIVHAMDGVDARKRVYERKIEICREEKRALQRDIQSLRGKVKQVECKIGTAKGLISTTHNVDIRKFKQNIITRKRLLVRQYIVRKSREDSRKALKALGVPLGRNE